MQTKQSRMTSQRKQRSLHPRLGVVSYAKRVLEALDTPVSLSCHLLLKYGEHEQLVKKSVRSQDYTDPSPFYRDYQAVKLLSHGVGLKTGIDTRVVALKKFLECEEKCRSVNERFRTTSFGFDARALRVFSNMQRKIARILGDVPHYEQLDFHFGPGASYGVRGDTSVYKKVSSTLECTNAMVDILPDFLAEFPGWISQDAKHDVNVVGGSQLIVVPKNAKTDRPICIEPLLNGLMQSGYGSYIRSRLSRWGICLKDQGVNQRLSKAAYEDKLATVDFSSASDTISYGLVLNLLPIDWFEALDICRSPSYEIEGAWYNFQKFSSMGNTYTFELESLIFFTLATSVCEELGISWKSGVNLSVYGDDVIIPQGAFDLFSEIADNLGFAVNLEKSFSEGSFFESCGHDYFKGTFVRPFILKSEPNKLTSAFYYANTVKRIWASQKEAQRRNSPFGVYSQLLNQIAFISSYDWVVGCIAPPYRAVGPDGYGDGHLIAGCSKGISRRHPSWDGWWFHSYVDLAKRIAISDSPPGYALYFCRGQSGSDTGVVDIREPLDNGSGYSVRGHTVTRRLKIFCHFTWQDISW